MGKSNLFPLVAALIASIIPGGIVYGFGIYGDEIKKLHGLSQSQVDTIGAISFSAGLVGWLAGWAVDRWGSQASLLIGALMASSGLLGFYGVAKCSTFSEPSWLVVTTLSFFGFVAFNASALITGGVFRTLLAYSDPRVSSGYWVGIAKGYVGLGAGIFLSIFVACGTLLGGSLSSLDYLLVTACMTLVSFLGPMLVFGPNIAPAIRSEDPPLKDDTTKHHIRVLVGGFAALLVATVVGVRFVGQLHRPSQGAAMLLIVLGSWLLPMISLFFLPRQQDTPSKNDETTHEESFLLEESLSLDSIEDEPQTPSREEEDLSLSEALQTWRFWLLFCSSILVVGNGTFLTNNLGQIVESVSFPSSVTLVAGTLFSAAQASARVITGLAVGPPEQWKYRPLWLVGATLLGGLAQVLLASPWGRTLCGFHLGVVSVGMSFGTVWPLLVFMTSDLFGLTHWAAIYMAFDGCSLAIGTWIEGKWIPQSFYVPTDPISQSCLGKECFQTTHLVLAILQLFSSILAWSLYQNTMGIYKKKCDR